MSDSLWPHGLQHTRLPCLSATPGVYSNSYPSSWWCHPTIYLILRCPLFLLLSTFPSIRVFSNESALCIRWSSIGTSASVSVLPMNIQGWFPLGLTVLIFLLSKGVSTVFSSTTARKHKFSGAQPSLRSSSYMTTGKTIALTIHTFVGKVMSLFFNMLSRFIISLLPWSKRLLI